MTSDQHGRFLNWLAAGAEGDPPRDLAVHAFLCGECARWVAAHDALVTINPARAALPPSQSVPERPATAGMRLRRLAAAGAAVVALAGIGALGAAQLTRMNPDNQNQGILAATGGPHVTATPSASQAASAKP